MSERVERNSRYLKLVIYALVAMATTPALSYLVPPFGFLFPDAAAEMQAGVCVALFVIHFSLFVLFLRLSGLLLYAAKGLALLFVINGLLLALFYAVVRAQSTDQLILTMVQMPIVIAGSYYLLLQHAEADLMRARPMKRQTAILAWSMVFIALLVLGPGAAHSEEKIFGKISDEELLNLFLIRAVGATDTKDLNSFNTAILLKWDRSPRFRVLNADRDLAGLFVDEVVRPLLVTFTNDTNITATVSLDDANANVLTIIGEDPIADLERYTPELLQVMEGDQAALDKLKASLQSKPLNCFAKPGLDEIRVRYAVIYVPQPKSAMFASAKCFGVSAARTLGFFGPDNETETVRNRTDPSVSFTPSDRAVLRILYDPRVLPRMTLEELTAITKDLNHKLGAPQ